MFHNTYQAGFLSILYSIGSKPLQIWDSKVQNGQIQRITDEDIQSSVLEILGTNVSTNYIHCPGDPKKTLGIHLPYLVLILKNLDKYFTFEVQVLDDKNIRRRFRASTFQSCTRVKPFICTMPMKLDEGWNQIQFNLADFTRRAYGTNYVETLRVQVHANCRLRRIYFSDRLYSEEELPASFKVFLPIRKQPQAQQAQAQAQHQQLQHHQRQHRHSPRAKARKHAVDKAEAAQEEEEEVEEEVEEEEVDAVAAAAAAVEEEEVDAVAAAAAAVAVEEAGGVGRELTEAEVVLAADAAAAAAGMAALSLEDGEAMGALDAAVAIDAGGSEGMPVLSTVPDKEAAAAVGEAPVGAS